MMLDIAVNQHQAASNSIDCTKTKHQEQSIGTCPAPSCTQKTCFEKVMNSQRTCFEKVMNSQRTCFEKIMKKHAFLKSIADLTVELPGQNPQRASETLLLQLHCCILALVYLKHSVNKTRCEGDLNCYSSNRAWM